jgi:hypothetical protein
VAGGLVPLSLGSDTNGSIRIPAGLCGIFGLKPTWGRLSRQGVFPFVESLDHAGAFARTVEDLALAYDLMQGPLAEDGACAQRPVEATVPTLERGLEGLRIGVLDGWFQTQALPPALEAVARVSKALGTSRVVSWPEVDRARTAAFIITNAEGGALHLPDLRTRAQDFEPLSRDRFIASLILLRAFPTPRGTFSWWGSSSARTGRVSSRGTQPTPLELHVLPVRPGRVAVRRLQRLVEEPQGDVELVGAGLEHVGAVADTHLDVDGGAAGGKDAVQ